MCAPTMFQFKRAKFRQCTLSLGLKFLRSWRWKLLNLEKEQNQALSPHSPYEVFVNPVGRGVWGGGARSHGRLFPEVIRNAPYSQNRMKTWTDNSVPCPGSKFVILDH